MFYKYLDDIATADIAFVASGLKLEEMFLAAAHATMNVMVEDLESIRDTTRKNLTCVAESIEMLLFNYLQEIIYHKDAEEFLSVPLSVAINERNKEYRLDAEIYGERLDINRHKLNVDVKAVTFHRFSVSQTGEGWEAVVVLDI